MRPMPDLAPVGAQPDTTHLSTSKAIGHLTASYALNKQPTQADLR